jgi:hypothetical protein
VIRRGPAGVLWRGTVVVSALVSLASLAWMRHQRALGPWETPHWDPAHFTELTASAVSHAEETWVVPVNLSCGSCFHRIERLVKDAPAGKHALAALIVDSPERPLSDLLERRGVRRVYWDERQVWRRRWGHALYGEVMLFERDGRLRITVPPGMDPAAPRFAHASGRIKK